MSKVTRILCATTESIGRIESMCSVAGFIRADIWRRYGGLGTVGRSASDIRKEINAKQLYSGLLIDGTVRAAKKQYVIYLRFLKKNESRTNTYMVFRTYSR